MSLPSNILLKLHSNRHTHFLVTKSTQFSLPFFWLRRNKFVNPQTLKLLMYQRNK